MQFQNSDGLSIVFNIIKTIQDHKVYLSDVDGAIGDGDHGINMNKGFTLAKDRIEKEGCKTFAQAMNTLGDVLLTEVGGSMGPLYGMFFMEMAAPLEDVDVIDAQAMKQALRSCLSGIQEISPAKVGDKTLMDVLIPSVETFEAAVDAGDDFKTALTKMEEAAEAGKESTKDLVAKIGRASRLGERSRGVLDPGATSCCLILRALSQGIQALL